MNEHYLKNGRLRGLTLDKTWLDQPSSSLRHLGVRLAPAVIACLIASGCSSPPAPPAPQDANKFSSAPLQLQATQKHQITLGEGIVLDYQIEQKLSRVNSKVCYSYITGVLYNRSKEGISKKTGLDVIVFSQGKQLFRDQTYPVADLTPGMGAAIEMVISPIHNEGCPPYERVNITMRRVPL